MFARMIDFGDVAVRFDVIKRLDRGVDGTTIQCEYSRDENPTTSMPYRDALRLYEEARVQADAEYREHQIRLAAAVPSQSGRFLTC